MAKSSHRSPEQKMEVVLSVLRQEASATEAARRAGVSEKTVKNWERAVLEGGRERLAPGGQRRTAGELALEAENAELKVALAEAYMKLRASKKGSE